MYTSSIHPYNDPLLEKGQTLTRKLISVSSQKAVTPLNASATTKNMTQNRIFFLSRHRSKSRLPTLLHPSSRPSRTILFSISQSTLHYKATKPSRHFQFFSKKNFNSGIPARSSTHEHPPQLPRSPPDGKRDSIYWPD